jgi:hypothetical protein
VCAALKLQSIACFVAAEESHGRANAGRGS